MEPYITIRGLGHPQMSNVRRVGKEVLERLDESRRQVLDGRRRFDELRIPRFAGWGALGGFVIGAGYAGMLFAIGVAGELGIAAALAQFAGGTTLLGAASAAGSLALARASDDLELLESGAETGEVGLTTEEHRALLGEGS